MKHKTFYPHTRLDAQDLNDLNHNQVQHEKHTAAMFSPGILHGLAPTVQNNSITISPGAFIAEHTHNNTTTKNIFYVDTTLTISPLPTQDHDITIYVTTTTSDPITDATSTTHNRTTTTTFTTTAPPSPTYTILIGSYSATSKTISLAKTPYAHALWHPRLDHALEKKLHTEIAKAKTEASNIVAQAKIEITNAIAQAKQEARSAVQQAKKDALNAAIPIGFVYVQFHKDKSPQELWGNDMTWNNISSDYSGCFFRAEGNAKQPPTEKGESIRSSQFFSFQNYPQSDGGRDFYLSLSADTQWHFYGSDLKERTDVIPYTSRILRTVEAVGHRHHFSALKAWNDNHAPNEFRPVNYTVRIWKRTA